MTKKVWKFSTMSDTAIFDLPKGAQVLHVAASDEDERLHIWVLADFDDHENYEERKFICYWTDETIHDSDSLKYISTVKWNRQVYHVFEIVEPKTPTEQAYAVGNVGGESVFLHNGKIITIDEVLAKLNSLPRR